MTPEQVSALSDDELNKAMIWLYGWGYGVPEPAFGMRFIEWTESYLDDWSATMPLVVENWLLIGPMNDTMWPNFWKAQNNKAIGISRYNENYLRAACECLVLIALDKKKPTTQTPPPTD